MFGFGVIVSYHLKVIYSSFFLCKYIYFCWCEANIWIVMCTECMVVWNVPLLIGMYLLFNWVESHYFILFLCLFSADFGFHFILRSVIVIYLLSLAGEEERQLSRFAQDLSHLFIKRVSFSLSCFIFMRWWSGMTFAQQYILLSSCRGCNSKAEL